jgi:Phosphodiester glycosidase
MWGKADNGCRSRAPLVRSKTVIAILSALCISGLSEQTFAKDDAFNAPVPAAFSWTSPAPGFDVTELAALEGGREVELIHLTRIDPKKFKFEVHTAPDGARELADWMTHTKAAMIVNGSYFARDGKPATPVIARGQAQGPKAYGTKHGAFVVTSKGPAVQDLARTRWQTVFRGASEAMVSFPMLIGADGQSRAQNSDPLRTANRSFIGQDSAGRIIIGTTKSAYFSLDRFAVFLAASGLDLKRALNLDGGPPACQAVSVGTFRRSICSNSETSSDAGQLRVLGKLFGQRPWGLPIVLAVFPK